MNPEITKLSFCWLKPMKGLVIKNSRSIWFTERKKEVRIEVIKAIDDKIRSLQ